MDELNDILAKQGYVAISNSSDKQTIEFTNKIENNYLQIQTLNKLRNTLVLKFISVYLCVQYKWVI